MYPIPTGLEPILVSLSSVRTVLFDIYGTLLISASGDLEAAGQANQEQAFQQAADAAGLRPRRPLGDALHAEVRRRHEAARAAGVDVPEVDIREVWRALAPGLFEGTVSAATLATLALEYECRVNPVWRMPGFPDVLDLLRPRFELGVVSNAQFYTRLVLEALAGRSLEALGLEESRCAWSFREGVAKPSPRLLGRLLERLQVDPATVLVVGNDLAKDVQPARELGCRTALFAGDLRSLRAAPAALLEPRRRPDVILSQLDQLVSVLGDARVPGSVRT
jgi:putative hydrolase of the HAD superfamily